MSSCNTVTINLPITITITTSPSDDPQVTVAATQPPTKYFKIATTTPISLNTLNISTQDTSQSILSVRLDGSNIPVDCRLNISQYPILVKDFCQQIHTCLTNKINASATYLPALFSQTDREYNSIGGFIVSYIAWTVFGHPRGTAPISNITSIISRFNQSAAITTDILQPQQTRSQNPTGDLAIRTVQMLRDISSSDLTFIARQIYNRDPDRFVLQSQTEPESNTWYPVQFIKGDKIAINIFLHSVTFNYNNQPSTLPNINFPNTVFSVYMTVD
jgi:hypothetical protein